MATTSCSTMADNVECTADIGEHDNQRSAQQAPSDRLPSPGRRLILLLCGSFNPVTIAHLHMLEVARDYYRAQSIQVLEGIISPVSNLYNKPGLAKVEHRTEMLRAAVSDNDWLRIDTWESEQVTWTRTRLVLDHHYEDIQRRYGENTELRLVTGADVARSMLNEKIWLRDDINYIMEKYGLACISRLSFSQSGSNGPYELDATEGMPDLWKKNIDIIHDWVINDISATNIRIKLEKGESVKYFVPDGALNVIYKHGLYGSSKSVDSSHSRSPQ